jgi:pentose-5-phosphate-3-epimerase
MLFTGMSGFRARPALTPLFFICCINFRGFAIEIDGGINNLTGRRSIERGAEWIVSGSYLFRGGSVQKNIERILYDA